MSRRHPDLLLIAAATALATSCGERAPGSRGEVARSCDTPRVRAVVEQLGDRLKRVSLQAPESILVREIRQVYGPLVTSSLLDVWIAEPTRAPGRQVSSPWPERIEIRAVESAGNGLCRLEGEVVYVTSVELTAGGAAAREPVVVWMRRGDRWQISGYEVAAPSSTRAR